MRLFGLTTLALVAFAANSLLNRAALAEEGMDAALFTAIRIVSGAVVLWALVAVRNRRSWPAGGTAISAAALMVYAVCFSFAYITLDAGLGALILFGGVQLTMFAGALAKGERPGPWRWGGAAMGFAGLCVLFLPGAGAPAATGAGLMLAAAVGWGLYSLRGAAGGDPLQTTAGNFLLAVPVALLLLPLTAGAVALDGATPAAIALAIASGALASGLGYAVWYAVLPRLDASLAAVAQLSVPLIAIAGGVVLLGEVPGSTLPLAALLILGGVAAAALGPRLGRRPA